MPTNDRNQTAGNMPQGSSQKPMDQGDRSKQASSSDKTRDTASLSGKERSDQGGKRDAGTSMPGSRSPQDRDH